MSEKKGDVFDSVAKTGGVAAAGILGSVFFPAIVSSSIDGWLKEQMAANPNALVFSCILAAIAGAGIACSIAIPVMRWWSAKLTKTKDTEISELQNRVTDFEKTQEQLDEVLAEREENLPKPLTGDAALNFVRGLTANQHEILKEMYDNGGTLEADPFDGEMVQLLELHMVSRPSQFYSGIDVAWTLPPNINMIIREHPDVLESEEEKLRRETNVELDEFSVAQLDLMARIVDACDETGSLHIPLSSQDGKIASQLIERLVAMSGEWDGSGYGWYLLPDWNKFVKRNRVEIDKRTENIRAKRDEDDVERKRRKAEEEAERVKRPPSAPVVKGAGTFSR